MTDSYRAERLEKLTKLRELGVDPFGRRYADVESAASVRARAEKLGMAPEKIFDDETARVAGRIMLQRVFGSLIFLTIRDATGDIQLGLSKKAIGPDFKAARLLDLGDIIGVSGRIGATKTGELTVWADDLTVLCKSLQPPPAK